MVSKAHPVMDRFQMISDKSFFHASLSRIDDDNIETVFPQTFSSTKALTDPGNSGKKIVEDIGVQSMNILSKLIHIKHIWRKTLSTNADLKIRIVDICLE